VDAYVDDMIVKSKNLEQRVEDLTEIFSQL